MRERLKRVQIAILKSLAVRGAAVRAVTLKHSLRRYVLPLWHRGIVEIWYRQGTKLEGPFFGLTVSGAQLATSFFPAPRGSSGAEDKV